MIMFADFIAAIWRAMVNLFNTVIFTIGSYSLGLFDIILGFIALGLAIKVFWKGA